MFGKQGSSQSLTWTPLLSWAKVIKPRVWEPRPHGEGGEKYERGTGEGEWKGLFYAEHDREVKRHSGIISVKDVTLASGANKLPRIER